MRVELDKKALFALASDSRLEILKAMQPMRRTVTQLADCIGIDKAAVHRHLKTLEGGGLVKRYEDHGFVYYGLSWKSRDLLSPGENTRVVILLSSICVMVGIAAILSFALFTLEDPPSPLPPKGPIDTDPDTVDPWILSDLAGHPVVFWLIFAGVVAGSCASAYGTLRIVKKPAQPGAVIDVDDSHCPGA